MLNIVYNGEKDKLAIKEVFPKILSAMMDADPEVVYLDADLMNSMGTLKLWQTRPDRVVECGIAEANMMGVAGGMSATGCKPFVHTFGAFAGRRSYDQVFISIGYAQKHAVIVGTDAGVTAAFNGGTHMPFEDLALYRAMPGATVIDVADATAFEAALWMCKDNPGVNYVRTCRKGSVSVYGEGSEFKIGKANILRDGKDCAIIACGLMVAEALGAAKILEAEGIDVAVIDPVTVKPLDVETVVAYAKKCGCIVTAENANVIGGLGAAVCECLSGVCPTLVTRLGVNDEYGEVGDESYLRERFGLTKENLAEKVRETIKKK